MPSMSQIGDFMVVSPGSSFVLRSEALAVRTCQVRGAPQTRPHPEEPRKRRLEGWAAGLMVRDARRRAPHHEEQARSTAQNISLAVLSLALWRCRENAAGQIDWRSPKESS